MKPTPASPRQIHALALLGFRSSRPKLLMHARALRHCEKMADVSLDEVIRQRGINLKAPAKR